MKRWLLRWLIGGEDVYVTVLETGPSSPMIIEIHTVHTDFDGADAELADLKGAVFTATLVVD